MAGLIDTIQLAGVLIFAIPAALAGLDFLLVRDRPIVGVTLLAVAIGLVLVQRYFSVSTGKTALLGAITGIFSSEESAEAVEAADDREE